MNPEHIIPYIPIPLLKLLYPHRESNRTRTQPLRVLALGLGRTGTDSLRTALSQLGYADVYHGFFVTSPAGIHDVVQWERLHRAKFGPFPDAAFLNRAEFDKVLGSSMAVTDLPSAHFAVELLRAYPEAKVVLNRRADVEAWYRSQIGTLDKLYQDWPSWSRQWFDAETFWVVRAVFWMRKRTGFDFRRNGREWYREHYEALEEELRAQNREWLDWKVQDGWEPLCRLLGEDVPEGDFPNENAMVGGGFEKKRMEIHRVRIRRAFRNMWIVGGVMVGGVAAGIVLYLRGRSSTS